MANNKFTQKQFYEAIRNHAVECGDIEGIPSDEVIKFCDTKLAQLDKKATASGSKKNSEHRALMDKIIAVLANSDKPMKAGEITKAVNANSEIEYSSQRINAMLRKMLPPTEKNPDGTSEVIRTEEKKDVFFSLSED